MNSFIRPMNLLAVVVCLYMPYVSHGEEVESPKKENPDFVENIKKALSDDKAEKERDLIKHWGAQESLFIFAGAEFSAVNDAFKKGNARVGLIDYMGGKTPHCSYNGMFYTGKRESDKVDIYDDFETTNKGKKFKQSALGFYCPQAYVSFTLTNEGESVAADKESTNPATVSSEKTLHRAAETELGLFLPFYKAPFFQDGVYVEDRLENKKRNCNETTQSSPTANVAPAAVTPSKTASTADSTSTSSAKQASADVSDGKGAQCETTKTFEPYYSLTGPIAKYALRKTDNESGMLRRWQAGLRYARNQETFLDLTYGRTEGLKSHRGEFVWQRPVASKGSARIYLGLASNFAVDKRGDVKESEPDIFKVYLTMNASIGDLLGF